MWTDFLWQNNKCLVQAFSLENTAAAHLCESWLHHTCHIWGPWSALHTFPQSTFPLLQSGQSVIIRLHLSCSVTSILPKCGTSEKKWIKILIRQVLFFNCFCFRDLCFEKLLIPIFQIAEFLSFYLFPKTQPHSSHNEPRKLSIPFPKQLPCWHTLQIQYFPCFREVQDLASFLPAMHQGHQRNLSAQHHRPVSHPVCPCKTHYEPLHKRTGAQNVRIMIL